MPHVDLPQAEFKVVLLGDTFTGKTSLVLRFAEGYYRESARSATVGAFFITKRLTVPSVGLTCKIQIRDTAGQEQFKPLAPMYYSNSAAAILCYDPASPKSLETLKYWLDELHRNVPAGRIVIAMAACKCDLLKENKDMSKTQQTIQNLKEVEELAAQMGAIFLPTSAKTNDNVTELFSQVAERVLQFQKSNKGGPSNIPVTLGGGHNSPSRNNGNGNGTTLSSNHIGLVPRPETLQSHQNRAKSLTLPSHNNNDNNHAPGDRPVSPHSVGNRDDYLHRRSHHIDNNNGSPTRVRIDTSRLEGSPILERRNGGKQHHQNGNTSGLTPGLCGDVDYLNSYCAILPGDGRGSQCVIL